MSTFTRLRKPATQPKQLVDEERCQQVTKVKTPSELLSTPVRAALCMDIKNKANAPAGVYQKFYKELIDVVAEFYQDLPGIHPPFNSYGGLLDNALHRASQVLEERLNHRFPSDESPEEQVAEEYGLWTYMLFTVALFRDIGKLHNCYQVYLCDSEGLVPRRWLPYDGAITQHSNYYRFKQIDTDRMMLDPSQWDKRAGPNLAYKLMTSEQFNWIHGNAAAYRIWWYELGDEEEEGRGGKGVKNALGKAEAATIKIAMTLDSAEAVAAFAEQIEQAQEQQEKVKNLPTLEMNPAEAMSVVEVTMVEWAQQVAEAGGAEASQQVQVHTDNNGNVTSISISGEGMAAFAQAAPQLAQQNGGAAGMHAQVSASPANVANSSGPAQATPTTAASNNTAGTANPSTPLTTQSTTAQVSAQIQNIAQRTAAGGLAAAAAAMTSFPKVDASGGGVRMTMSR